MSDLNPAEWNFSEVGEKDSEACVRYELAREVQDWTSYFDPEIDLSGIHSMSDYDILLHNSTFLFPGITFEVRERVVSCVWPEYFPATPWLQIPEPQRIGIAERYSDTQRAIRDRPAGTWKTIHETEFAVDDRGLQVVPFTIDWKQSNGSIVDDLRRWLEENRPDHIQIETERGRQSLRDDLNAISAMRLRHHYRVDEAVQLTRKVLGKSLYSESFTWDRAATRGVELFKAAFPGAGEPRSAVRKSNPRGRPPK